MNKKTYLLTFSETIHYSKIMTIDESKNPDDVLMDEIDDLSDWKIEDVDTLHSEIKEIKQQKEVA